LLNQVQAQVQTQTKTQTQTQIQKQTQIQQIIHNRLPPENYLLFKVSSYFAIRFAQIAIRLVVNLKQSTSILQPASHQLPAFKEANQNYR